MVLLPKNPNPRTRPRRAAAALSVASLGFDEICKPFIVGTRLGKVVRRCTEVVARMTFPTLPSLEPKPRAQSPEPREGTFGSYLPCFIFRKLNKRKLYLRSFRFEVVWFKESEKKNWNAKCTFLIWNSFRWMQDIPIKFSSKEALLSSLSNKTNLFNTYFVRW